MIEIENPSNLSNLLFAKTNIVNKKDAVVPYVSPKIQVSTSTQNNTIIHGRGLIATQNIAAGECLFVIPPTFDVNVEDCKNQYLQEKKRYDFSSASVITVESIAESMLIQSIKESPPQLVGEVIRCLATASEAVKEDEDNTDDDDDDDSNKKSKDLRMTRGGKLTKEDEVNSFVPTIENLLIGTSPLHKKYVDDDDSKYVPSENCITNENHPSNETILRMIRYNAFGPDFITYDKIETVFSNSHHEEGEQQQAHRILGLYPLAAMLNHSCCPNVVRVYKSRILIAHASQSIKVGEELVWSYVPPTTPYQQRLQRFTNSQSFHFQCRCSRCQIESTILDSFNNKDDDPIDQLQLILEASNISTTNTDDDDQQRILTIVPQLEDTVLGNPTNKSLTNEAKRYLRMGFCQTLYIPYLNLRMTMIMSSMQTDKAKKEMEDLLRLCTQLHFTFCACNNGSTEHLSVSTIFATRIMTKHVFDFQFQYSTLAQVLPS